MSAAPDISANIRELRKLALLPALGQRVTAATTTHVETLTGIVMRTVPEYSASRNPDIEPELKTHLASHVEHVASLLAGGQPDTAFVRQQARRYAEQHFPLDACLRAYRSLSRPLADRLRDDAISVAPANSELRRIVASTAGFALEYATLIASVATDEYVASTRLLAEAAGDRKTELLNLLLDGFDESDRRAGSLLRSSGYLEQRQTYAVVAVRAAHGAEMDSQSRVQRIQETLQEVLHGIPARVLVGCRDDLVIAVLSATHRQSGWTRPHTLVSELALGPLRLMGNAVLIGVSNDVPSTAHIPRALAEAQHALQHAHRGKRVLRFAEIDLLDLILERARPDFGQLQPAWLAAFLRSDKHGKLATTLQAYAANDMNVLRTAKELEMHPNSIYARFAKIEDLTGFAPQSFHALSELLLALRLQAH